MPGFVHGCGIAADTVGVGEVARHRVEPHRLGREPGACDVEYLEGGHVDTPGAALLACYGGHEVLQARRYKGECRVITHRVIRKCRLLELRVDGIAAEGGSERHAIFESAGGVRAALDCCSTEMT